MKTAVIYARYSSDSQTETIMKIFIYFHFKNHFHF